MGNRWAALRTLAAVFKVLAYIEAVIVIIAALICLFKYPAYVFFMTLIGGAISFLYLYATAEGLLAFISIEENTRKTAEALEGKKSE